MHPRNIALVAFSVVVIGALVLLLVKVTASAEMEVPEAALAEARARYARSQAAHSRRSSTPAAPAPAAAAAEARARRARKQAEQAREAPARTTARLPPAPKEAPPTRSPREDDLQAQRNELRSAYDRGNYELALQNAKEYLRLRPNDRYVMRVTVTSACAVGDEDTARSLYEQMTEEDRRIERLRCSKYGVDL